MKRARTLTVRVTPNAKQPAVTEETATRLLVKVDAPPKEGKANHRLIEILASHFGIPRSKISIVKGEKGKIKVVEIT